MALFLFEPACFLGPQTVTSRFSGEFVCPKQQVKVDKIGDNLFRASGCGRRATYRCTGEYSELCERLGQPESIVPESTEAPPGGEPAQGG